MVNVWAFLALSTFNAVIWLHNLSLIIRLY